MDYGKLGKSDFGSTRSEQAPNEAEHPTCRPKSRKLKLLFVFSATFLLASAVSVAVLFGIRTRGSGGSNASGLKPTLAISRTCSKTRYPDLCIDSLLQFPGANAAGEHDLVHISVNMTMQRVGKALYDTSGFRNLAMDPQLKSAYDDCLELLDDSYDQLSQSLGYVAVGSATEDVTTWLSAALTNQDTCTEGLGDASGDYVKSQMEEKLKDLSELVSNCLAIYSSSTGGSDFSGIPIQNRRRLMSAAESTNRFPGWMSRRDRLLMDAPASQIQADIVVSKDGNGTYKTISEAIKKAPEKSKRRFIIYVKAGKYEEDILKVGRKKTNLMFIGDGKGRTVIQGKKSVADKLSTFHTASFAAQGAGFIARDMSFDNYAGPAKHQAVALRVGADHAVIYRCSITGYQDTLYVHSNRQFYRECDIYGTVDFIFGNAAVVLQNCNIYARKPMDNQKNTITAQNRKDPNQNTGISIHACKIAPTADLEASKGSFPTYLGRPWKMYSRVVYLMSSMGDHIHPQGWLEWNATFALDTLYYGEYMNYGPGAAVGQRVNWTGYHVMKSAGEASKFTVARFIYGSTWLPSTGVAFLAGLSV